MEKITSRGEYAYEYQLKYNVTNGVIMKQCERELNFRNLFALHRKEKEPITGK